MQRGFNVSGRQTIGDFRTLPFDEQDAVVATDLRNHFWHSDAQVIANSFGCYLFLHAQTQLAPFVGRVLLLSQIVGEFDHADKPMHFSPTYPTRLSQLAKEGLKSYPIDAQIHVGTKDWQSVPDNVLVFGKAVGIPVHLAEARWHMLGEDYVRPLLDVWLA